MVENYYPKNLGINEIPSVLKGISEEKIPNVQSFIYHNGGHNIRLESMPESNGYQWKMEFMAPKYVGEQIVEKAVEIGYASNGCEIDPREEEIIRKKVREYIA